MTNGTPSSPNPTKWWQWAFVYPTLLVALITSIPTVLQGIKSVQLGVKYNQVDFTEKQKTLWEKNVACLYNRPLYQTKIREEISVGVTICPSGDALINYSFGEESSYNWIPLPRVQRIASFLLPLHSVYAENNSSVLIENTIIFGAVIFSGVEGKIATKIYVVEENEKTGTRCVTEKIDLSTGRVISKEIGKCP